MCKFGDNQIRFEDFEQPVGMKMSKENRWVKKAELIPWDEIEKRYAALFKNKKPKPPGNSGALIVDATCAPSQIKYPQDTELLNEAREITEGIIDTLHNPANCKKPRTYRKQARKAYLNCVRKRKKTTKEIRKAIKKQLGYLRRNLESIDKMLPEGKPFQTNSPLGLKPFKPCTSNKNTCMTTASGQLPTVL